MCPFLTLRHTTMGIDICCICKGGRSDHHDRQDLSCRCTSATARTPRTHGAHLVDGVQAGGSRNARGANANGVHDAMLGVQRKAWTGFGV
jgi:hypothetical protein